jgi:hypothetical protein
MSLTICRSQKLGDGLIYVTGQCMRRYSYRPRCIATLQPGVQFHEHVTVFTSTLYSFSSCAIVQLSARQRLLYMARPCSFPRPSRVVEINFDNEARATPDSHPLIDLLRSGYGNRTYRA